MSKSVLIIDTPVCCADCILTSDDPHGTYCIPAEDYFDGDDSTEERALWCPLRELPQRENINSHDDYFDGVKVGLNICLDAITGGAEDGK